jgi:hypothetical protein
MKNIFAFVFTIIIFLFSSKAQSPDPPVSGNNPYENIGSYHNVLLDSFFSNYNEVKARKENLSRDEIKNFIIQKASVNPSGFVDKIFDHPIFKSAQTTTLTNLPNTLEQMQVISVRCGNYLRTLDAAIDNDLETSFDAFNSSTIQLENNVLQDQQLTEAEKGVLFSAAATARHSSYFWKEYAETMEAKAKGSSITPEIGYIGRCEWSSCGCYYRWHCHDGNNDIAWMGCGCNNRRSR